MNEHLGYEKHSPKGKNSGNSRNGYSQKQFRPVLVILQLMFQGIVMVALNLKLSRNMKKPLISWKTKLLLCMLRACLPGILKII